MVPGDRLICCLLEPLAVGSRFTSWPLHITIVPWFRLADSSEWLALGMGRSLTTLVPFTVNSGEIAMFGPRRNRPATLIEPSESLASVERHVRSYLHQKRAWLVDETTKKPYDFRPHVTYQGENKLEAGASIEIGRLFTIEQKGDYKEVVAEIKL